MNVENQNLEWKLCEAYFLIVEKTKTSKVSFDQLCLEGEISSEEVEKIVPKNSSNFKIFFLKILISKLDKEVLRELEIDLVDDTVSSTYDKILEGLSLRFDKYLQYKQAFEILSNNSKKRIEVFFKIFRENYDFFINLLSLIEEEPNFGIKVLKSIALNIVFTRGFEKFLKNKNKDLDPVIRYLDKYLSDAQDLGFFMGIIKK